MALGSLDHSIAVFLSLFALSIGIAAVAIGAQQEWTCSAYLLLSILSIFFFKLSPVPLPPRVVVYLRH